MPVGCQMNIGNWFKSRRYNSKSSAVVVSTNSIQSNVNISIVVNPHHVIPNPVKDDWLMTGKLYLIREY